MLTGILIAFGMETLVLVMALALCRAAKDDTSRDL
jgi:hypothetical protein